MMSLSNVKAYVLTAATSGIADLTTALFNHFNSAPGLWRLKSGASSSAAGMVIEPKTPVTEAGFNYNIGVSIRRNGTTDFRVALDPLNTYTTAGNASGGPSGGSAQASGDRTLAITSIASVKIMLIEMQDAIAGFFFNAALTNCPQAFHIGHVFDPIREGFRLAPLFCNGLAVLVGLPHQNSTSAWGMGTSGQSVVRHNGGWRPMDIVVNGANSTIPDSPNADKETTIPMICNAYNSASSNPMRCLIARYLCVAIASRNTRQIMQSDLSDEAWIHMADGSFNLTASTMLCVWEKGVAKPV